MIRPLVFAPVLCVALAACQLTTDARRALDVSVVVNRQVVSPIDPLEITVTAVNRGLRDVQTADPHAYDCSPPYAIFDGAGNTVALPGRVCSLILYAPVILNPGDSIVIHGQWSADMADASLGATPVAPGRYSVVAQVVGDGRVFTSDPLPVSVVGPNAAR